MGIGNDLIGGLEQRLVTSVLSSRRLFRFAAADSFAHRFERSIGRLFGGRRALLLPSASTALESMLRALALPREREVLVAPFGWVSNFSGIRDQGLVLRFVPLDKDLQLTADAVSAAIMPSTGALLVTHLMGRAQAQIEEIAEVCRQYDVILIEDVAQAFGVRVGGSLVGTFGRAAFCSLNHHKILSTGDGGLLITPDEALMRRVHARHDQGCVIEHGARRVPTSPAPGSSLRQNELTAAVALAQLTRFRLIKTLIWKRYHEVAEMLSEIAEVELIPPGDGDLPFLCLFRRPGAAKGDYPSLATSGWHSAANVPYLADHVSNEAERDAAVGHTFEVLSGTFAVGCGLVDDYFAAPVGLSIRPEAGEANALRRRLEERL